MTGKRRSKVLKRENRKKKKKIYEDSLKSLLGKIEMILKASEHAMPRNFLECDECNLVEDQKIGSPVFTRFRQPDGTCGDPTDMEFRKINKTGYEYECPNCQNILMATDLEEVIMNDEKE
jgi:hypothetical protein